MGEGAARLVVNELFDGCLMQICRVHLLVTVQNR